MKIIDLLDKSIGILFIVIGVMIIISSVTFWIKCILFSVWLMIVISTLKMAIEKEQYRKQRQKDALDKSNKDKGFGDPIIRHGKNNLN